MQPKKQLKVQYIGIFEEIDSFYWPKMHFSKKGQKIRAWVDPPLLFGQSPKENVFFCIDVFPYQIIWLSDIIRLSEIIWLSDDQAQQAPEVTAQEAGSRWSTWTSSPTSRSSASSTRPPSPSTGCSWRPWCSSGTLTSSVGLGMVAAVRQVDSNPAGWSLLFLLGSLDLCIDHLSISSLRQQRNIGQLCSTWQEEATRDENQERRHRALQIVVSLQQLAAAFLMFLRHR